MPEAAGRRFKHATRDVPKVGESRRPVARQPAPAPSVAPAPARAGQPAVPPRRSAARRLPRVVARLPARRRVAAAAAPAAPEPPADPRRAADDGAGERRSPRRAEPARVLGWTGNDDEPARDPHRDEDGNWADRAGRAARASGDGAPRPGHSGAAARREAASQPPPVQPRGKTCPAVERFQQQPAAPAAFRERAEDSAPPRAGTFKAREQRLRAASEGGGGAVCRCPASERCLCVASPRAREVAAAAHKRDCLVHWNPPAACNVGQAGDASQNGRPAPVSRAQQ